MTTVLDDRRKEVICDGVTTYASFDYGFPIHNADELTVIRVRAGVEQTFSRVTGTITTGKFSVDANFPDTTTITVLPTDFINNDLVILLGNTAITRASDYAPGGDYFASTVNREQDKQTDILQELARDLERSVTLSPGQSDSFDTTLPIPLIADQVIVPNSGLTGFTMSTFAATPASVTDNAIVLWDGTDGKNISDSLVICDSGSLTGIVNLTATGDIVGVAGTFSGALTAPSLDINGTIAVVGTIDDDTMDTATNTTIPTSESVKAYVDAKDGFDVATTTEVTTGTNNTKFISPSALNGSSPSFTTLVVGGGDPTFPVTGDYTVITERDTKSGTIYLKDLLSTKTFGSDETDGTLIESNDGTLTIGGASYSGTKSAKTLSLDQTTGDVTLAGVLNTASGAETFIISLSDQTTALTTGTKETFYMPYAFTITEVKASCITAPTDATLIVDIHEAGTTIMATNKLDITTGTTLDDGTAVVTDTSIAADAKLEFIIDQIGSSVAGAGLKVTIMGNRT